MACFEGLRSAWYQGASEPVCLLSGVSYGALNTRQKSPEFKAKTGTFKTKTVYKK